MIEMRWVEVAGYPDYEVSDAGFLRRLSTGRMVKIQTNKREYPDVALFRDGVRVTRTVHRIVLESFVGPCPEGHQASHLNGDSHDSRLTNLAWETVLVNQRRRQEHGTQVHGEAQHLAVLNPDAVHAIRILADCGMPQRRIAAALGIHSSTVTHVVAGRTWRRVQPIST